MFIFKAIYRIAQKNTFFINFFSPVLSWNKDYRCKTKVVIASRESDVAISAQLTSMISADTLSRVKLAEF
jgi:hypothetical protein